MISDWVLDDLEKFFLGVCRPDGESMEQLNHKTGETLECSRYADRRADFNENTLGCMDVYLQLAGLVDWRIKESEETLVSGQVNLC